MGWNGADLVDDFSAELGDTSTSFKVKVLRWINDGIRDISTSHQWPFLRQRGKVILTSGSDTHLLSLQGPAAPTLVAQSGGSLTDTSSYKVLVTFYEASSDTESEAGTESASITIANPNKTIRATIPSSKAPLVTARKIYLSKDGGPFYYYATISNNTTITTTITADTTSEVEPPEESYIGMLDGDPYITGAHRLDGYTIQRIRHESDGIASVGTPYVWAPLNNYTIVVYPKPSSSVSLEFYYFKLPRKIINSSDSVPQIPSWLFDDLYNYVMWRGYAYRDRDGKESKQNNYQQGLRLTISRKGAALKRSGRIRSVTPDSDGFVI